MSPDERKDKARIFQELEERLGADTENRELEEKGRFTSAVENLSDRIKDTAGESGSFVTYVGVGAGMGAVADYFLPIRTIPIIGPASTKLMSIGGGIFGAYTWSKKRVRNRLRRQEHKANTGYKS